MDLISPNRKQFFLNLVMNFSTLLHIFESKNKALKANRRLNFNPPNCLHLVIAQHFWLKCFIFVELFYRTDKMLEILK